MFNKILKSLTDLLDGGNVYEIHPDFYKQQAVYEQQRLESVQYEEEKAIVQEGNTIFEDVIGYDDVKEMLVSAIESPEPINILLSGPPGCSKTVFLLAMRKLTNNYFLDGSGATGPGTIDYLFENDVDYLLIDEIDKMRVNDQEKLLNLLETGILSETKKTNTRQKEMRIKVFATSNQIEELTPPLRSRFMEFHLPAYTYNDFVEIAKMLLPKKYGLTVELAEKIANAVWNELQTRDVRDVIQYAKLVKTEEQLRKMISVQKKYGKPAL